MPDSQRTHDLLERARAMLEVPRASDASEIEDLMNDIRAIMADNPATRRTLGPALGRLSALRNALERAPTLDLVNVSGGTMAIGHRPAEKTVAHLRLCGVTHVVTLSSASEGATRIQDAARRAGLEWLWLPLEGAEPPTAEHLADVNALFDDMADALRAGGCLYVHCSAGIHRTGMITYAFLRYLGHGADEASDILRRLRETTAENVGEHRKAWADATFAHGEMSVTTPS